MRGVSLLVVLSACESTPRINTPEVLAVEPNGGPVTAATPVAIHGRHFYVSAALTRAGVRSVDTRFAAELDGEMLADVRFVDSETLTAVVPAGLTLGWHELRVTTPEGGSGTLARAFEVRADATADGRAPGDSAGGDTRTAGDSDTMPGSVELLAQDPLGDGSTFSFVFAHAGRIWMGPSAGGESAVSVAADGRGAVSASFRLPHDSTGSNQSRNAASPPYPSLGRAGCSESSLECGPDNEDGRGLFTGGTIAGEDWLVAIGARSAGDLDYAYLTRDSGSLLDFAYVDLASILGGQTRGPSTLHAAGGRLYLGFADTGGSRPYLSVVLTTPSGTGLEGIGNAGNACDPLVHDICDLAADDMPAIGRSAPTATIDSIGDFHSRVYVANNGGIVRSTRADPLDAKSYPGDWIEVSPSHPAYGAKTSVTTTKTMALEPADKAVPGMVVFGDRMFFARNTTDGPQLWICHPSLELGPFPATVNDCDAADWYLVAANTTGDTQLTQLDEPGNGRLTLLAASASYLYVGFDNPSGALVARTNAQVPLVTDFAVLGGAGLGVGATRIFSHALANDGVSDFLYVTAGDGSAPVSLLRVHD